MLTQGPIFRPSGGHLKSTFRDRLKTALLQLQAELGREIEQSEIAEATGVTPAAVSHWFTGRTVPGNIDVYVKLARFLRVSLDWLAVGESPYQMEPPEGGAGQKRGAR